MKKRNVMKLSEWQPAETKPTIKGVYQVKDSWGGLQWCYWHGKFWNVGCYAQSSAALDAGHSYKSITQNKIWRGVL